MPGTITVLAVEDDDDHADVLAFALARVKDRSYEIRRARSLSEFFDRVGLQPDIILLDLHLPDSGGLETVRRTVATAPGVPVVVLTGSEGPEIGLQAVEAGAQDFVPKTELLSPLLSRAIDFAIQRRQAVRATEQKSLLDAITGLGNRTCFMQELESAIARAERHGGGFALGFIDLDGFKAINDTYGHAAGDEVLATIGSRCRSSSRANDCLCRLGGDEFVFLLDGVISTYQAVSAAERYTAAIELPILLGGAANSRVSVGASLGLALWRVDGRSAEALLSAADARMYANKAARHRIRRTG
ncbi:MAG TPA: GGDEF domain-containing response regulator [Rhizomicrobium sp.]|jgi:diguanylate cyclase (GGDEF)-like protein|nr:GGDEF domain-containing response regulator [Rhizomicrobium sp.]